MDSVRISLILLCCWPILPVSNMEYKSSLPFIQIRQIFSVSGISGEAWSDSIFLLICWRDFNDKHHETDCKQRKCTSIHNICGYAKFTNIHKLQSVHNILADVLLVCTKEQANLSLRCTKIAHCVFICRLWIVSNASNAIQNNSHTFRAILNKQHKFRNFVVNILGIWYFELSDCFYV